MDTVEKWRPVSGLEDKYAVSNFGRVKSLDRIIITATGYARRKTGVPIRTRLRKTMPSVVHIKDGGKTRVVRICELVAKAFVPNPENLPYAVHVNGDIHDDSASNIAWSTEPDCTDMEDWGGTSAQEHRLYNIWKCMLLRCEDESRDYYDRYGGRGIKVCREWHDFNAFVEWSYSNGYEDGLTIDRIDNDSGYAPGNCRWVAQREQALNRSSSILLEINGKTLAVSQWAEIAGISRYTIYWWVSKYGAQYAQRRILEKLGSCDANDVCMNADVI